MHALIHTNQNYCDFSGSPTQYVKSSKVDVLHRLLYINYFLDELSVLGYCTSHHSSHSDTVDPFLLKVAGDVWGSGGGDEVASGERDNNQKVSAPHSPNPSRPWRMLTPYQLKVQHSPTLAGVQNLTLETHEGL